MLQNTKVFFFTVLLMLLSWITNAGPALYLIDKGANNIVRCKIKGAEECKDIYATTIIDGQKVKFDVNTIRPNAAAFSKDGTVVVFSSEDNHVYVCTRNTKTNILSKCFKSSYAHFENPQGMVFDGQGNLFVTNNTDNGSIISCQNIESQNDPRCKVAYHLPGTNSIVLSHDDNYAYTTQPDMGTFQICRIDHRNNIFSSCIAHSLPNIIKKPMGIAIDNSTHYLLIVDAASPSKLANTISCQLNPGGGSIGDCLAWASGSTYTNSKQVNTPANFILTTNDKDLPIMIGSKDTIYFCLIDFDRHGSYYCPKSTYHRSFNDLYFAAYTPISGKDTAESFVDYSPRLSKDPTKSFVSHTPPASGKYDDTFVNYSSSSSNFKGGAPTAKRYKTSSAPKSKKLDKPFVDYSQKFSKPAV